MPETRFIDQWRETLEADAEALAAWREFAGWASPVHQWCQIFLPHWFKVPISKYHSQMLQFMVDTWLGRLGEGKRRGVVVWPRSFGKSTCGRAAALYMMTEAVQSGLYVPRMHQDYDMIYITGADDLALQSMQPIWNELYQNKGILGQYGKVFSFKKLREKLDCQLNNGFWVKGCGKGGRLLGNHPVMMHCDDLEDSENISSEDQRTKFRNFWDEVLNPMMMPGGMHEEAIPRHAVIVGNYTHISCWLRHIAQDPESETMLVSALMPNHKNELKSVWENRYSTDYLLEQQQLKPYEFATLYMNKPMLRGGSIIGIEDIKYYSEQEMAAA